MVDSTIIKAASIPYNHSRIAGIVFLLIPR
jgi:hypothetical protein